MTPGELKKALNSAQARATALFEGIPDPLFVVDRETSSILDVNSAALARLGFEREAFINLPLSSLLEGPQLEALLATVTEASPTPVNHGIWQITAQGHDRLEATVRTTTIELDGRQATLVHASDVGDRRELQRRFLHAQRMMALGWLAEAVGHEINNQLLVTMFHASIARNMVEPDDRLLQSLDEITKSTQRNADLVRQLSAFSRRPSMHPRMLHLGEVLLELESILNRLLPETVELTTTIGDNLGPIYGDQAQLEQVLLNMVINAREAIDGQGRVHIEANLMKINEEAADKIEGLTSGVYIALSIEDSGHGMSVETIARCFEPKFTTKVQGVPGSGLGLSVVHDIIAEMGGTTAIESTPGTGTTFTLYLPIASPWHTEDDAIKANDDGKMITILLVEDQPEVRDITSRLLISLGYDVLDTGYPGEALLIAETAEEPIDLLLSDIVLPRLHGVALAERLRTEHPDMKVLYMSGYSYDGIRKEGVDNSVSFLAKPFTPKELAAAVREALN